MRLTPRTVFLLCTLLLGMQFGALSHASEHAFESTNSHVPCHLCSFSDRGHDQLTALSKNNEADKASIIATPIRQLTTRIHHSVHYLSRAPPYSNTPSL
jgi:hypothetical protein